MPEYGFDKKTCSYFLFLILFTVSKDGVADAKIMLHFCIFDLKNLGTSFTPTVARY